MPTVEELAANLPDPTKDPRPPERVLTQAEIKAINSERREKRTGRRDWSNPAEQMMARILEGAFGAANVRREADRQQGYQNAGGNWHYYYANFGKPDITFATVYNGKLVDGVMEVKSVAPSSKGLALDNIKPQQIKSMNKAKGKLCLWGFVFWEGKGQARCFVVKHSHLMQIIKIDLIERSWNDPRFQGRSIRRDKDFDLMTDCEVMKTNRWYLPEGHWFRA